MFELAWKLEYMKYRKKYNIHPTFKFNGENILFYGDGEIECQRDSYIGRYSSIQAKKGCKVKIGKGTAISSFVRIYTANRISQQNFSKSKIIRKGNVIIGDYCWIGSGVFIKEGVTIGDNVVVGANSVITKDIPSYVVVAGNPAKIIKEI